MKNIFNKITITFGLVSLNFYCHYLVSTHMENNNNNSQEKKKIVIC